MRIRAPRIYLAAGVSAQEPAAAPAGQQQPRVLVEDVQVENNRRLRDEDVLYHIQTRKGDVFNPAQVQRDLQALLNLPFFDKTETRVSVVDPGPLGGVVVRFEVKE